MTEPLSVNTTAVLLLTAPLMVSGREAGKELLTPSEYRQLVARLKEVGGTPADLVSGGPDELITACATVIQKDRLQRLLARGFQLSQAVSRWQSRGLWVISRADAAYPQRLKRLLRGASPPLLYGCGSVALLDGGGLAVVGSRKVDESLLEYTRTIGRMAVKAACGIVSGGARGVDQAAMTGALDEGGRAVGILADSLEKTALKAEYREALIEERLVLASPYDPRAGFNVGNAMQRNKLIYALSDAALVVNADFQNGGTWAGAIEQLDRLRLVRVYVRGTGASSKGLDGLREHGAQQWPDPDSPEAFRSLLEQPVEAPSNPQDELVLDGAPEPGSVDTGGGGRDGPMLVRERREPWAELEPGVALYQTVREQILRVVQDPVQAAHVATVLSVTKQQAEVWLKRLESEGEVERLKKPIRYVIRQDTLFGAGGPPAGEETP